MPPPSPHHGRNAGDSQPAPPPKPNTKILSFFLKALIMIWITSLFFLLLGLVSVILLPLFLSSLRRHHRRRRLRDESSYGFSPRRLKKLPQFKFSSSSSDKTDPTRFGKDCVVCLDGFKQGQWCRRLIGCGHVFHRKCVDVWLVKSASCPTCRARVRLEEEEDDKEEFWACFGQRRSILLDL